MDEAQALSNAGFFGVVTRKSRDAERIYCAILNPKSNFLQLIGMQLHMTCHTPNLPAKS
jgi:hypothetical protein